MLQIVNNNEVRIAGHEYLISSIKQQINHNNYFDSPKEEIFFQSDKNKDKNKINIFSLMDYSQKVKNKYNMTKRLIATLTRQLEYLIKEFHVTFYEYRKENVFVFVEKKQDGEQDDDEDDDEDEDVQLYFLYISNDFLPINNKHKILFSKPFDRENNLFLSPEIKNIKQLPQEIHYKTVYYSLGTLSLFFYLDANHKTIQEALQCIEFTKLYWLIQRCLHSLPERRTILYL